MSRLCFWGMHRPGPDKIFHQGKHFTRCTDCGDTLLSVAGTWRGIPPGKRVVWLPRTDRDRFFERVPNHDRARLRFDPFAPFRRVPLSRRLVRS